MEDFVFYVKGEKIVVTQKELEEEQARRDAINWLPTMLPFLRPWRIKNGLTQEQLAIKAGLSIRTIVNLERPISEGHDMAVASNDTIKRLMAALDIPFASWLFEFEDFIASVLHEAYAIEEKGKAAPVEDLKVRRKAAGLSQEALAEQAGVHVSTVRTADRGGSVSQASRQSIRAALPGKERT